MEVFKGLTVKEQIQIHWRRLLIALLAVIAISFGLAYLFQSLASRFEPLLHGYAWLAYLAVFVASLISNMTVLAPVPLVVAVMVAAARVWNPLLIALVASVGGAIGELSGYYAGYFGRKIAIPGNVVPYTRIEAWIQKYGPLAIFVLALQPILPFDVAGLIAGAARMPLVKFLPALWLGKLPKYILLTYAGIGLINNIPFLNS